MVDREKVIKGLEICSAGEWNSTGGRDHTSCPYYPAGYTGCTCKLLMRDALALLKEQEKEIEALQLLVEWAEECDFGFDQFPDEYERYKDEINDMKYIDGMIHIAKRTLEDRGAFK